MADPFDSPAEPEILAVDESLVAVRKPPRMHSAPGRSAESLCSWVFRLFPDVAAAGRGAPGRGRPGAEAEGGLLHRLDYETSGLVLFARSPEALAFLLREQEAGRFVKEYLLRSSLSPIQAPAGSRPPRSHPEGLDAGEWEAAAALGGAESVAALIGPGGGARIVSAFRPFGPGAARVACLGPGSAGGARGAAAEVPARLYATSILGARALGGLVELRASLDRGFRHQIRAHAAWVGLPILGDPLYGGLGAERLYLHASKLRFAHPATGLAVELADR